MKSERAGTSPAPTDIKRRRRLKQSASAFQARRGHVSKAWPLRAYRFGLRVELRRDAEVVEEESVDVSRLLDGFGRAARAVARLRVYANEDGTLAGLRRLQRRREQAADIYTFLFRSEEHTSELQSLA